MAGKGVAATEGCKRNMPMKLLRAEVHILTFWAVVLLLNIIVQLDSEQ